MYRKILYLFVFLFFVLSSVSQAQDTREAKKDSSRLYRKIEGFSKRNKVAKWIYRELFRSLPSKAPAKVSKVKKEIIREQYYSRFEGKVIRNIEIVTYDPFGYKHDDTSKAPRSIFEKAGNAVHLKTMNQTVKQLLIIKKNDRFDSLRVRESERLVRSRSYIHEVVFRPKLTKQKDSVDIFIRVYDVWSIIVIADISKSGLRVDMKDKSFLGTGHEFQNVYSKQYATGAENYRTSYSVPNICNTFISSSVSFDIDEKNNYNRSLNLNRPFYSAFAKWAGGATYLQHFNTGILYDPDSIAFNQKYKYDLQDYWAGKALRIQKGRTENARTTQMILSGRLMNVRYFEKPSSDYDSLNLLANEAFYFLGLGVTRRRYDQDRYLFRYGHTEDVPVGRAYSLVSGYQIKNQKGRYYMGARVYWGQYHPWGYLSSSVEYGTFFYNSKTEEGTLSGGINYFTNIFKLGGWRIRQFVKPQCTIGFDRLSHDNLSINNELGIRGFNSTGLVGYSQKMVLTLQTQSYAPWNLLGFRFGPYLISSFAMLGTASSGFRHSKVYSQYGIGLLIRNEYLIYHSLQISIAFYPTIPGNGDNVFKINPVKTTDFGFRDFDFGKPATISYQ